MKIDKVLVSSDANMTYAEFWPIVAKAWKHFGLTPVLLRVSDKETDVYDDGHGLVKEIKAHSGHNTSIQAQLVRIWGAKYFPGENCLISDIDMIPLSGSYFIDNAEPHEDDNIVVYSSDAYGGDHRYPMCYILAKSEVFNQFIGYSRSYEEFIDECIAMGRGWDTDEIYITNKMREKYNVEKIVKLNRGWSHGMADRRVDRVNWNYQAGLVKQGYYIDCHSLRPYTKFKEHVDYLVNLLYK